MGRQQHRYRSSSGGSFSEMVVPRKQDEESIKAAIELLSIFESLRNDKGKSFLHWASYGTASNINGNDTVPPHTMGLVKALLERASEIDYFVAKDDNNRNNSVSTVLEQVLLARDLESGYTPLHSAVLSGNLGMILQILRYASLNNNMDDRNSRDPRFVFRPINMLQAHHEVALKVVQAKDHEGFTPLDLLSKLQTKELTWSRELIRRSGTDETRRRGIVSLSDEQDENEFQVLQQEWVVAAISSSPNNIGTSNKQQVENSYGCEVLTFGSVNGSSISMEKSAKNGPAKSRPQRIQEFALSQVGLAQSAVAVAAATHHSLVATRNGQLYAFGLGKGGRLGTGDERQRPIPTLVGGPLLRRKVVAVAAAEYHSLCTTKDGFVYAWGSNRFGQLGTNNMDNDTNKSCLPKRVDSLKGVHCVSVAAGDRHSVALSDRGEVYTWGDNQAGQLGQVGSTTGNSTTGVVHRVDALWSAKRIIALAISAGAQSTLALTCTTRRGGMNMNSVYAWGHGNHIPIKVNFSSKSSSNADRLLDNSGNNRLVNPVAISSAKYHNAAITSDGRVYTWGLHTEPLGNTSKSRNNKSMVIASPQLVAGMLTEHGGGKAVAVSACENRTAILTDCGHLYTWGATYGQNVLGHEGVSWQPSPKRVPGVYRAVNVSVAKEHTILMVGTSVPPIEKFFKKEYPVPSSLEHVAARTIAKHVDLFNVIPIAVMARRANCNTLQEYCQAFIRFNMDGVLTLGRKSEMDTYLNEELADSVYHTTESCSCRDASGFHPLLFHIVTKASSTSDGRESDFDAWLANCKELRQSLPPSLVSSHRATFLKPSTSASNSQVRRTRRKSRGNSIGTEQESRIDEQRALERQTTLEDSKLKEAPTPEITGDFVKEEMPKGVDDAGEEAQKPRITFRCDICNVSCSDAKNFELHKNGRKHRNRQKQAEAEEQKKTAATMMEMKRKQLLLGDTTTPTTRPAQINSPWKKNTSDLECVQPKYRLPPPPSFPSPEHKSVAVPKALQVTKLSWINDGTKVQSSPASSGNKATKSFQSILEEEEKRKKSIYRSQKTPMGRAKPMVSPSVTSRTPWSTPSCPLAAKQPLSPLSLSPTAGSRQETPESKKQSYSLGDFLVSPSSSNKTVASSSFAAPWAAKSSVVDSASKSFVEIQQEEEDFVSRQDHPCGVKGHWYVQRRERAGSLSKIQEQEEKDREMQQFVEEQKRIEAEIVAQQAIQEENGQQKRNRRNRQRKKPTNKKQGGDQHGNAASTDASKKRKPRPRNRNKNKAKSKETSVDAEKQSPQLNGAS